MVESSADILGGPTALLDKQASPRTLDQCPVQSVRPRPTPMIPTFGIGVTTTMMTQALVAVRYVWL
jgi:hypothetical protein